MIHKMIHKVISILEGFLAWGFIATVMAGPQAFGAETLKGADIVTVGANSRSNRTNDLSRPSAVPGMLSVDGKGHVTVGSVTTTAGPIGPTSGPVSGTYIVASNGSGMTNNPPFILLPSTSDLVLDECCGRQGSFLDLSDVDDPWDQASLVERAESSFVAALFKDTYVVNESWLNRVVGIIGFKSAGAVAGACCFFGRHGQ
jgi:hypothetical protein